MRDSALTQPPTADEKGTRQLLLAAGTAFGLVYGLSFALMTWGYDSLLLSSVSADLPWAKLLIGLPFALIVSGLIGRWAVAVTAGLRFLVLWPAALGLLSAMAAHVMFAAVNPVVWIIDGRFWGLPVYPFGYPDPVRTGFVLLVNVALGASVGLVGNLAVDWGWDRATPTGRMSWRSWAVMLVCIPLALPPVALVNDQISRPVRLPQLAVGRTLELASTEAVADEDAESAHRVWEPFQDDLVTPYVSHFVGFVADTGAQYSAHVDVAFTSGRTARCVTFGDRVIHCSDLGEKLTRWMDDLVHAGRHGERRWEDDPAKLMIVPDRVMSWLADHGNELSQPYEVHKVGQRGGWILMHAQFDTGFAMQCRFVGAAPILVERCLQAAPISPQTP